MEDAMSGPFGPFEAQVERLGDLLVNKVSEEIFGDGEAARLTRVVICNHTEQDLYFLDYAFESGGFSTGLQPTTIEAKTIGGYRVESHGLATGVTGAIVHYGFSPSDAIPVLEIATSNPYAGDNSGAITAMDDSLTATGSPSLGNANEFLGDVFAR
jgi:hypothetical protein